jgi:hypothetical protein
MANYCNNEELEQLLCDYYATHNNTSFQKICNIFFEMAKHLAVYVARKKKFNIHHTIVDDMIQAGTLKAMREIHKFDASRKRKMMCGKDAGKRKAKAFNFFTTVISNEMVQEIMKQDRKNWYRHEEKSKTYVDRATTERNLKTATPINDAIMYAKVKKRKTKNG